MYHLDISDCMCRMLNGNEHSCDTNLLKSSIGRENEVLFFVKCDLCHSSIWDEFSEVRI